MGTSSADNIEFAKAMLFNIVELIIHNWFASIKRNKPLFIAKLEMKEQLKKETDALLIIRANPPCKAELYVKDVLLIVA